MTKTEAQKQVDKWDSIIGTFGYLEANVGLSDREAAGLKDLREKRCALAKEFDLPGWWVAEVGVK